MNPWVKNKINDRVFLKEIVFLQYKERLERFIMFDAAFSYQYLIKWIFLECPCDWVTSTTIRMVHAYFTTLTNSSPIWLTYVSTDMIDLYRYDWLTEMIDLLKWLTVTVVGFPLLTPYPRAPLYHRPEDAWLPGDGNAWRLSSNVSS